MNDMIQTIIPKSDQLNADDLIGGPRTIKVVDVKISPTADQPVAISYENDGGKPYMACKSMRRVLVYCWGPDANAYAGRSMTLFRDPKVQWGGFMVGGIRISHLSHIDSARTMSLAETKKSRKPFTVQPLVAVRTQAATQTASSTTSVREAVDALVARLDAAQTPDALTQVLSEDRVQKIRDWLHEKNPTLSAGVEAAIDQAVARLDVGIVPAAPTDDDDGFPGDKP